MLRQNNIDVIYVCDEMPLYTKQGIIAKMVNHYQRYWLIRRELRKLKPDIVHFHLRLSNYIRFAGLDRNVRLFYTQHYDTSFWEKDYPDDIKNLKWLMKRYQVQPIALNKAMKASMDRILQTDQTRILNNGVDMSEFQKALDRNAKRNELNVPQDAFVIAHVGRFDPIKNHEFLVKQKKRFEINWKAQAWPAHIGFCMIAQMLRRYCGLVMRQYSLLFRRGCHFR